MRMPAAKLLFPVQCGRTILDFGIGSNLDIFDVLTADVTSSLKWPPNIAVNRSRR